MNTQAYEFKRTSFNEWETMPINKLLCLLAHAVDYEQSKLCDNSNWEGLESIKLCLQEMEMRTRL